HKLEYCYCDLQYDIRREITLPAPGGRQSSRPGARYDPAGSGPRYRPGAEAEDQPVLLVADRKWGTAALDQQDAVVALEVFQSPSGIPGGRSGRLPYRASLRREQFGRQAGPVANPGCGTISR